MAHLKDAARGLSDAQIEQLTSYHIRCKQKVPVLSSLIGDPVVSDVLQVRAAPVMSQTSGTLRKAPQPMA